MHVQNFGRTIAEYQLCSYFLTIFHGQICAWTCTCVQIHFRLLVGTVFMERVFSGMGWGRGRCGDRIE